MGSNENDIKGRYARLNLKMAGAIFMANRETKEECYDRKLFGLPQSQAGFIRKIKCGMFLFLFEYEERKLFGVFEATSNGALNIMPSAFTSSGKTFPAQIYFKRVCCCQPLVEEQFRKAIEENYFEPFKFNCSLSHEQVVKLLYLFVFYSKSMPDSHIHQLWRKLENDSDKSKIAASRNRSLGIDSRKRSRAYDLEFRRRDASSYRDIIRPVSSGCPVLTSEDHIADMEHEQDFHSGVPPEPWVHIANVGYSSSIDQPYLRRAIPHSSYPGASSRGVYPNYHNYEFVPRAVSKEPSVALGVSETETSLRHKLFDRKRLLVNMGPSFGDHSYQSIPGMESNKCPSHSYPSSVVPTCQGNYSDASHQVFDPCRTNSTVSAFDNVSCLRGRPRVSSSDCPGSTQSQILLAKQDFLKNDGLSQLPSARNPATPFSSDDFLGNQCDYDYIPLLDDDDENLQHSTGDSQILSYQYPEPLHMGQSHFSESEEDEDHSNLILFYRSHAHGHIPSSSSSPKHSFYSDGLGRRPSVFSRLSKANTSADIPNPSLRQSFLDTFEGSEPQKMHLHRMPEFLSEQLPPSNDNKDELRREYDMGEPVEPFEMYDPEPYDTDEPEPYGAEVTDGLPFLDFKRKSESRSSGRGTENDGGSAAQDEKPKRRRLVRPSFSEESGGEATPAPLANVGSEASGSTQSVAAAVLQQDQSSEPEAAVPDVKPATERGDPVASATPDAVADLEPPMESVEGTANVNGECGCINLGAAASDPTTVVADFEPCMKPFEGTVNVNGECGCICLGDAVSDPAVVAAMASPAVFVEDAAGDTAQV